MSELKSQLTEAMKNAMRAKDKETLGTIRMMLAEVKRVEVDERIEVDDARVLAILTKMQKQRQDAMQQFEQADRLDLAAKEKTELEVIASFLPAPLSEEEINALIAESVNNTGASSMADMGKLMASLKPQITGRADMAVVSKLVKAKLS